MEQVMNFFVVNADLIRFWMIFWLLVSIDSRLGDIRKMLKK